MNTINAFVDCWISENSATESFLLSLFNELVLGISEDRTVESVCFPGSDILFRDSSGALHSLNFLRVLVPENVRVLVRGSWNLCRYRSLFENFLTVLLGLGNIRRVRLKVERIWLKCIRVPLLKSSVILCSLVVAVDICIVLPLF